VIIAFAGRKLAGKDSAAQALVSRHGFIRVGLADALKDMFSEVFRIKRSHLDDQSLKEVPFEEPIKITRSQLEHLSTLVESKSIHISEAARAEVMKFEGTVITSIRHGLQLVGTDIIRNNVNPDIWLEIFAQNNKEGADIVVTDARFPNERAYLKAAGALIVLVERPGFVTTDTHISEQLLGTSDEYDAVVTNNSTIHALHSGVSMWYSVRSNEFKSRYRSR
jgi:hypothetical protein